MKRLISAFLLFALTIPAIAAPFTTGQVLTASELNAALATPTITGGTINGATIGATTPSTGAFTSLSATVANPSFNYQSSATGSVARGYQSKLGDTVSLLDFAGCDPTGVADSSACVLAAVSVPNIKIVVPPGTFKISGTFPFAYGTSLKGAGRLITIFKVTSTNLPVFQLSSFSTLSSIQITSSVAQTSGSIFVTLNGSNSQIDDFYITNDYVGILMTGSVSKITNGRMTGLLANGIHIRAEGGDTSQIIDGVLGGDESSPNIGTAGIRVRNSSALTITNTSMIQEGVGLLIDPYTNTTGAATDAGSVYSLNVSNSFFDNSNPNGIRILPTGTANVVRLRFNKVWTGSSGEDGVYINNTGSGVVSGIYFTEHHSVLNAASGITTIGTVSDVQMIGGTWSQNAFGGYFASGLSKLGIHSATIGAGAGLTGNTNYGLVLVNGVSDVNITGNLIEGNTIGAIADEMTSTNKVINNNNGYNGAINSTSIGATTPSTGAFTTLNATGETFLSSKLGIGVSPASSTGIYQAQSSTGATSFYGYLTSNAIQSDVTVEYDSFRTNPSTQNTAFTLASLNHYFAGQGTIGAGSTVTNQYGFNASSALVGAANNYGFYGNIAAASGRWNFFANGTANNAFNGKTRFGGVTAPVATVDVTGSIAATIPIAISSGGTGAATAGAALTNLGAAAAPLSATTASIGGGALAAGACASATTTVTGATTAMVVNTSPTTYPGDGNTWQSYISAANTVITKVCAIVAGTPTASTYNIRVSQ